MKWLLVIVVTLADGSMLGGSKPMDEGIECARALEATKYTLDMLRYAGTIQKHRLECKKFAGELERGAGEHDPLN